ncbi:MAG: ATP-binding cassette domain-containing protein [Lachnospiraceae bacterium]|nr:ATP-binding cassette domain-containing protein [Lachnospiraceae bacterium]
MGVRAGPCGPLLFERRGRVLTENRQEHLLEVQNLKKYFPVTRGAFKRVIGRVHAVDDVSFYVDSGETLGIVGESGCGKTSLGKCVVRLHTPTSGQILLRGEDGEQQDLLQLDRKGSFEARRRVQMVFQDPYASMNPMKSIWTSFDEPLRIHGFGDRKKRLEIASHMMESVNLQPEYLFRYPHEFSGGQRQRICIARALALNPKILVCDEPVSALDVSIQAQIMNLMRKLQKEFGLTYIFIAHDLSVVEYMSSRIAVMYLGKIVETAPARNFSASCIHPYAQALMSAVPIPKLDVKKEEMILTGDVPSPIRPPQGCRFHPRCLYCTERCKTEEPKLRAVNGDRSHMAACHRIGEE